MFCDIDKWVNQLESKHTGDIISTSYLDHILLYGICCMLFASYSDEVNKTGTIYFICDLNICIVSTHQFIRFRKAICCILFVTFFLNKTFPVAHQVFVEAVLHLRIECSFRISVLRNIYVGMFNANPYQERTLFKGTLYVQCRFY